MKPDMYNFRARFLPALVSIVPLAMTVWLALPWTKLGWIQLGVASLPVAMLFLMGDLARRLGKRTERRLFASTKGKPFPDVLRHRDATFDAVQTAKYHRWLGEQLGETPPAPEDEERDQEMADAFYNRCGAHLRERVRHTDHAPLVHEENMVYGMRRNLYGLRVPALVTDVIVAGAGAWLLKTGEGIMGKAVEPAVAYVLIGAAAVHAAYFLLAVTRQSVVQASTQYGRQLVLTIETLSRRSAAD